MARFTVVGKSVLFNVAPYGSVKLIAFIFAIYLAFSAAGNELFSQLPVMRIGGELSNDGRVHFFELVKRNGC